MGGGIVCVQLRRGLLQRRNGLEGGLAQAAERPRRGLPRLDALVLAAVFLLGGNNEIVCLSY